jgi:hypothetical protein
MARIGTGGGWLGSVFFRDPTAFNPQKKQNSLETEQQNFAKRLLSRTPQIFARVYTLPLLLPLKPGKQTK